MFEVSFPLAIDRDSMAYQDCTFAFAPSQERFMPLDPNGFFGGIVSPMSVDQTVLSLLGNSDIAMCRSTLQSYLMLEGISPIAFNESLKRVSDESYWRQGLKVHKRSVNWGYPRSVNIYAYGRMPSPDEVDYLQMLDRMKQSALSAEVLGKIAEQFVRAYYIASGYCTDVTRKSKLGCVGVGKRDALDLVVVISGIRYGIEVKNRFAMVDGRRGGVVDELIKKCRSHTLAGNSTHPWLVVAYATENCIQYCREKGVGLTVLGFQVLPRRVTAFDGKGHNISSFIDSIRPIWGARLYQTLGTRIVDLSDLKAQRMIRYLMTPVVAPYGYSTSHEIEKLGTPEPIWPF